VNLLNKGLLTPESASKVVGDAWSSSEFPDRHADHDDWRALFSLVGYPAKASQRLAQRSR